MRKRKALLKAARKQYRDATKEEPKRQREIVDPATLAEYKEKLIEHKKLIQKEKRVAKKEAIKEKRAKHNPNNPRVEWYFEPGMLVSIKENAFKKYSYQLKMMNLYSGAIGVIVSIENEYDPYSQEKNRYVDVLSPMGEMQRWNAKWIEIVEE